MNVTDQGFTRGECFKNDEFMIDFQIDKSDLFLSVLPSLKKDLICILKEINLEYRI